MFYPFTWHIDWKNHRILLILFLSQNETARLNVGEASDCSNGLLQGPDILRMIAIIYNR